MYGVTRLFNLPRLAAGGWRKNGYTTSPFEAAATWPIIEARRSASAMLRARLLLRGAHRASCASLSAALARPAALPRLSCQRAVRCRSTLSVPGAGATSDAAASAAATAVQAAPRAVGWWLLGTSGSVFAMVVVGGITRLTRSGLSMTDWRPQGKRWPRNAEEWEEEFERYKQFPEYQRVRAHA